MVPAVAQECVSPCDDSVALSLKIFPTLCNNAPVRTEPRSKKKKKAEV